MNRVCIGIDFGGTFIKFGTLAEDGVTTSEILQLPTPVKDGPAAIIAQIKNGVRQIIERDSLSHENIVALGIGSPGPLSVKRGIILNLPNIPNMQNIPIARIIGEEFDIPAALENDANAAAYGEYLCGAGKGCENIVMLTLGTGVGGGVIQENRVLHGTHEIGGELGHMIVQPGGRPCGCGQRGCLEQYCSAAFLAKYTVEKIKTQNPDSSLTKTYRDSGELTALDVNLAQQAGDAFAIECWDECCYYMAIGCINLCRIFDPDRIVIAGGMSKAGDELINPTLKYIREFNWRMFEPQTPLAVASLGNSAGMIGAAGVAWLTFGEKTFE
ncbi:MAG TPA: ROK family protein [Phycisphaerae bacterium]|nr:ROK family protein [Phycisphaerae bacterium]HPS52387.1 ROK family protein [Phycisphaerae bacterium]